jgi:DNA primase
MLHSAKYLIHAEIRTSGVVERSDVVGAIFGQTEGLLGDELDLRGLQEASKIGRIDVDIESEDGRSFGTITIGSGLDRVQTAVLAAALETIERVGPCRSDCTVTAIEDARAAKRRELVDRATDLLTDLEDSTMTSENLVEAVRQQSRVEDITEFEGVPAGPRVADSDAIIVVEGRADVRRLLRFGVKNAVAVEGTDIPDAVARLTTERTTTVLLDGDRGGDLILEELTQVGSVDYVAFAPAGKCVEDLDRSAIMSALRKKVPYEQALEADSPREAFAPSSDAATRRQVEDVVEGATDPTPTGSGPVSDQSGVAGDSEPTDDLASDGEAASGPGGVDRTHADDGAPEPEHPVDRPVDEQEDDSAAGGPRTADGGATAADQTTEEPASPGEPTGAEPVDAKTDGAAPSAATGTGETPPEAAERGESSESDGEAGGQPTTLQAHVEAVIGAGSGQARLLSESFETIEACDADDAFDAVADAETVPHVLAIDGTVTQRLLDVAAQRGVGQIVGTEAGEFVKQPTSVRVLTGEDLTLPT